MRFVLDAQLPPALAAWLVAEGHDAVHVFALGLTRAGDATIWQHARETDAIIVTKTKTSHCWRNSARRDQRWCGSAWGTPGRPN